MKDMNFREINGFPDYRVTDTGECFKKPRGGEWKQVAPSRHPYGYLFVMLKNGAKKRKAYIHQLVLEAFVGKCPKGMVTRHYPNRDPKDNRLVNLRWGTHQENADDKWIQGSRVGRQKLTEKQIRAIHLLASKGIPRTHISRRFKLSRSQVCEIALGTTWRHLGLEALPVGKAKGERHYKAKLTEEQVREIRRLYASRVMGATQLAEMFKVGLYAVWSIIQRKCWKHVK